MRLTIDGKLIDVEPGTTILKAAEKLGVEIPTLCYQEGIAPRTSCFVCVVKLEGNDNFHPACTTPCAEGMIVHSSTPEVTATRKTALELILSDHAGSCVASCSMGCPADLDIPGFTKPQAAGDNHAAIEVIKRRLAFPATLGYVCPGYCESACLRKKMDESVWVRSLHRIAAEADLAAESPYLPPCKPATGKCVAIVGAGPAGLSMAFYLLQEGHDVLIFEAGEEAGGNMRRIPEEKLPRAVLDAEIALIEKMGAQFKFGWKLGQHGTLDELRDDFDAVLLAFGATVNPGTEQRKVDLRWATGMALKTTPKAIFVDKQTQATSRDGVFAVGEAALGPTQLVWAVATGRIAAASITQYLRGDKPAGEGKQIYFRRPVSEAENHRLYDDVEKTSCALPKDKEAQSAGASCEAGRCLQCGCPSRDDCALRFWATKYNANFNRFRGARRELDADTSHPEITYEPGKCILCGLCIQIAKEAGEELGLCFVGRGFKTRVTVPLGGSLAAGLTRSARACAEACPSGALTLNDYHL